MECVKCGSLRMMEFVDGFGQRRVFCKGCGRSSLDTRELREFNGLNIFQNLRQNVYYNSRAAIRHRW